MNVTAIRVHLLRALALLLTLAGIATTTLVPEARIGIGNWFQFYNHERLHQSLGYRTPTAVYGGR